MQEEPAGDSFYFRRGGQVDQGAGALFGAGEQFFDEPGKEAGKTGHVVSEPCAGRTRTHAIDGHAGALEPLRQVQREDDVLEFRTEIGAEEAVTLLTLKVAEIEPRRIGFRGDVDDPATYPCLDEINHEVGEQKRTQMIGGESPFDSVDRNFAFREDAG